MKKFVLVVCLCFIASKTFALGFGQTCRFTCTSALAQKAAPKILEAGGDPSGDDLFLNCANSCRFSATKNMWYTLIATGIYYTDRKNLEKSAGIDSTLSNLIPELPIKLKYPDFVQNLSIELLTKIPAYGESTIQNRKSSFLGGELLPNVHTDEFEAIAKQQPFIKKYLNHSNDRHKKVGESLLKALVEKYKDMLSKLEGYTDKRFGNNLEVSKKEIFKPFQKQTPEERKLGTPAKSKGAWYSFMPIRSCARNCSTLQHGQQAGLAFTKKVIHDGTSPEDTLLYWCQQNCEPENYGAFYCGAYDNIAREEGDFKKNTTKALNKMNKTKNRIYVTKKGRKLVEQCLNLFNQYGIGKTANDVGEVYKYNVSVLAEQAIEFDKAGVEKVKKSEKTDSDEEDDEDYEEDDLLLSEDEIADLIKAHS